jgi:chorismate mutase
MPCLGIRGAVCVEANTAEHIVKAAVQLLEEITKENQLNKDDVAAIIFTATKDLNSIYPAVAARSLGWDNTALMCTQEMDVRDSMPMCLRVLILWNTELTTLEIKHIYIGEARRLRPDLVKE